MSDFKVEWLLCVKWKDIWAALVSTFHPSQSPPPNPFLNDLNQLERPKSISILSILKYTNPSVYLWEQKKKKKIF